MAYDGIHVRKSHDGDKLFDATTNLDQIEAYVKAFDADPTKKRDLQTMDIFAGEGNFTKTCKQREISCASVDILYDNVKHNFVSETGFYHILSLMLTVVSGICLVMGWSKVELLWFVFPCFFCWLCPGITIHNLSVALASKVEFGWLLLGPPCGLFVFMSSSYHGRNCAFPYGDQEKKRVREANQIVINMLIMLCIAHYRRLFFLPLS